MIPYSQHPFPLSGVVAFAGSRHGSLVPGGAGGLRRPLLWRLCVRWLRRRPWFDPVFKDVRQKLVDVRAGRLRPAAHGDVVVERRQDAGIVSSWEHRRGRRRRQDARWRWP